MAAEKLVSVKPRPGAKWPQARLRRVARAPKDQILAFKVDAALAGLLASVKNKSELIRDAVYAYLGHLCPLCEGKGTIPANRGHEIELLLKQLQFAACSGCHTALPIMPRLQTLVNSLPSADRLRLTEFRRTGELLCAECFQKADTCDTCGVHVPHDHMAEHRTKLHLRRR